MAAANSNGTSDGEVGAIRLGSSPAGVQTVELPLQSSPATDPSATLVAAAGETLADELAAMHHGSVPVASTMAVDVGCIGVSVIAAKDVAGSAAGG
ncbi:MAG UNVERIFIED_CONTAM: hypothetical protein LVR18_49870 [Planctomycetaceae bacterium]|jgi:hypothetical protein